MAQERMKVMLTIVSRGDGLALSKLYDQNGVSLHIQAAASGTASSEILNLLGLTHTEKDLLISFAPASTIEALLSRLDDDYRGILSVRGIAFSLRLTGISNVIAAAISTNEIPAGGVPMNPEKEYSLILVTVNQGCTDEVMHTACKAGATGGSIIRGRWVGTEKLELFHGITLQDEKEILMIACPKEQRNAIMDGINAEHGLNSEAQAAVFSLPIDRYVRLG